MSSGTKFRCSLDRTAPARLPLNSVNAKKPDHIGLFGNNDTQNPRPTPQEKSGTTSRKIRDLTHVEPADQGV